MEKFTADTICGFGRTTQRVLIIRMYGQQIAPSSQPPCCWELTGGILRAESFHGFSAVQETGIVLVQMELVRIIISEINDQQVVFLKEIDGERAFPILIGVWEATSIDRRVRGETPHRPLTHDLLKNTIEQMGGTAQDVVVNNLQDHTYFAVIRVKKDGELIEIDSRPSDAIALAVHYQPYLPIFVEDTVLQEVAS